MEGIVLNSISSSSDVCIENSMLSDVIEMVLIVFFFCLAILICLFAVYLVITLVLEIIEAINDYFNLMQKKR